MATHLAWDQIYASSSLAALTKLGSHLNSRISHFECENTDAISVSPAKTKGNLMFAYNELYPSGKELDLSVCLSLGHQWKRLFCHDREFRHCLRCERMERKENNIFVINKIKPTVI